MQLSTLLVALAALAPSTFAQDNSNYTTGLADALNGAGLTALATALASAPAALLQALQEGNHTVFAPSDSALGSVITGGGVNPADIPNILAYHVAAGAVNTTALNETQTIIRSSLTGPPHVFLPNNQSQVLIVQKASNGTVYLDNNGRNVTVSTNATYANLQIQVINRVLTIPGNLSTVLTNTPQLSGLAGAIQQRVPNLVGTLAATKGLTLFLPVNQALTNVESAISAVNDTVLTFVLLNHIINGTALYSPEITNGLNITGAGGKPLTFTSNTTGTWVTSGSSSAQILQPNILTANGVVHLIGDVLLNTENDPEAASDAAASISSSEAEQTATETGPITPSDTAGAAIALEVTLPFSLLFTAVAGALLGASLL